ncbi:hypothetical protein OEZ86_007236 [Tetradesmus obliquus]|nr:hypothetical protein OEZ86_007236 [Tetradesmus obliquus]
MMDAQQPQQGGSSARPQLQQPAALKLPTALPASEIVQQQQQQQQQQPLPLRGPHWSLQVGHQCLSSGCADLSCCLCKHNESRRCKTDLRAKYVTRDYLRSNCGAGLLLALVDESGQRCSQQLPGWKLQVCVLDAKRYKELNPGNAPLGFDALSPCILDKALLRWEAGSETAVVSLPLEYGQVCLNELQCFSISGEHRPGKACDYRLAFWIENQLGIAPQVSEPFTVVCLRSRAAVKSEVPLADEPVGRLEGIGEQAVATLKALGQQLSHGSGLPLHLASIEKVGQFCELIELAKQNSHLEKQLLPLFKKADWKKATQHAAIAVSPDFRPRVWWCPNSNSSSSSGSSGRLGLLFRCENAVVQIQRPFAWVHRPPSVGLGPSGPDELRPFIHPGQQEQQAMALAAQDWDTPGHGSWGVYWNDTTDPLAQGSSSRAG